MQHWQWTHFITPLILFSFSDREIVKHSLQVFDRKRFTDEQIHACFDGYGNAMKEKE